MATVDPYDWIKADLQTLHRAGWHRSPRNSPSLPGPRVQWEGREVIQFASNDYLGLSGDSRLITAACEAAHLYGTGATGSRLLSGERPLHRELELALATWKGTEDCLVFSSGYLANLGVIPAVMGKPDLVLADRLNHACLNSGMQLSGATSLHYDHGDPDALEALLDTHRHRYRRCLLCTDSVFSMDGDLAPLPRIAALAHRYECMLLVDEAHATGVLGASGAGAVEHFALSSPLIEMGTLSKALGSLGGYICGHRELIDYLRNRAKTWVYTTGLSPADCGAALRAVQVVACEPERRAQLWRNIRRLQVGLAQLGLKPLPGESAIVCLPVGNIEHTQKFASGLLSRGFYAPAIRPPTVPTSRIRFSLMATHTEVMIDGLLAAIGALSISAPSQA